MNAAEQAKLAKYVAETYYDDPTGYCRAILQYEADPWQTQVMNSVRDHRKTAVRSGNGPGKTRLDASIIHWYMATRGYPVVQATAGRFSQLKGRLWRELNKVNQQARNRDLFEWAQTSFYLKANPTLCCATAIPWSKSNPDAFAGAHEKNVLTVFDEASAIDDVTFDVTNGSMTTPGARWLITGNPTRNKGYFAECFGKNAWKSGDGLHLGWHTFTVSSFDTPRVDNEWVESVVREYGLESDYYRVHVLGLPPRQEDMQFISEALFTAAVGRTCIPLPDATNILGVDPAYTGGDRTAGVSRKGLQLQTRFVRRGQDTMATCGDVIAEFNRARDYGDPYHFIVIDKVGIGAGVYDRLKEQRFPVLGVNVGTESRKPDKYVNLRAELADSFKDWLREGSVRTEDAEELCEDATGIHFDYDSAGRLRLEKKDHMKARGLASPDLLDASALTFYPPSRVPVQGMVPTNPWQITPQHSPQMNSRHDAEDWRSQTGMM